MSSATPLLNEYNTNNNNNNNTNNNNTSFSTTTTTSKNNLSQYKLHIEDIKNKIEKNIEQLHDSIEQRKAELFDQLDRLYTEYETKYNQNAMDISKLRGKYLTTKKLNIKNVLLAVPVSVTVNAEIAKMETNYPTPVYATRNFNLGPLKAKIEKFGNVTDSWLEFEQQKNLIKLHLQKNLCKDYTYYLISSHWFKQWRRYVGYYSWDISKAGVKEAMPGLIDNSTIIEDDKLRKHQLAEIDYKLIPEEGWDLLVLWYGVSVNTIPIARKVIEYGKYVKQFKVEVYPLELKCCIYPDENNYKVVIISRADKITTLIDRIKLAYSKTTDCPKLALYYRYVYYTNELITNWDLEAQDVGLFYGQYVFLDPYGDKKQK